ncbi:hypothetical protein Clacol_002358 [Clathrus columnatus]|uniref:Uncharacterized protein n=1 Tax=Clathrus columnatus TaxID=1419009 RepID=A0AAV5A580_9AGAM|nr:hypothetical protein Clacol_002358 [Clathrus columnatus]
MSFGGHWPLVSGETREAEVFGITENNEGKDKQADGSDNGDAGCLSVINPEGNASDAASTFPFEGESLETV